MTRKGYTGLLFGMLFFGCVFCPSLTRGSDKFLGDEAYLRYPHSIFRLRKERVVIRTDENGDIVKVYWYSAFGSLRRIHLPQENTTLFVNKYGTTGKYVLAQGTKIYRIVGGTFDHFDIGYRGGAGIADMATAQSYLSTILDSTTDSLHHLEESLRRYEIQPGTTLTKEQFQKLPDATHPLMSVKGMNLAYFFDGRGHRIMFERESSTRFHLSSPTLAEDQQAYEKMKQAEEKLTPFLWFVAVMVGIPVLIILGFPLVKITGFFLVVCMGIVGKFSQHMKRTWQKNSKEDFPELDNDQEK